LPVAVEPHDDTELAVGSGEEGRLQTLLDWQPDPSLDLASFGRTMLEVGLLHTSREFAKYESEALFVVQTCVQEPREQPWYSWLPSKPKK